MTSLLRLPDRAVSVRTVVQPLLVARTKARIEAGRAWRSFVQVEAVRTQRVRCGRIDPARDTPLRLLTSTRMLANAVGFHQDEQGVWVLELSCGHSQHVRHDPPWQL